jgi:site-specific DNA recombinase
MFATTPTAAAIYVRWSTDEQGAGTTLEEQRQTCLNFVAERGWSLRPDLILIDEGYSAGSLERPGMKKLRQFVNAGAIDAVVVYKLDRLTRNIVDAVDLVLREWEGRCALISVTQSAIDTTNALGRQFFTLMASFAEFEREMIRDRTLSGKKRRAMQGRNPGFRPPYGYTTGERPGEFVMAEEKAAVVRRLFDSFAAGSSMMDLARQLNKEAIPCPRGGRGWSDRTIRYMLQNPIYVGRLEYGKSSVNSPQKKRLLGRHKTVYGAPRWAVVPDSVTPVVAPELWQTVQRLMGSRSQRAGFCARAASSSYLLTGIMKCPCGYNYAGHTARGVDWYRCRSLPGVCTQKAIRADQVEQAVMDGLRAELGARIGHGLIDAVATRVEAAQRASEVAVINVKESIASVRKQGEMARRDYMAGDLPGRLFAELVADLEQKGCELQSALVEAESAVANPQAGMPDPTWLLNNIDQVMSDTWSGLEMGQKKYTLRTLVSKLVVWREAESAVVEVELTLASMGAHPGEVEERQLKCTNRNRDEEGGSQANRFG